MHVRCSCPFTVRFTEFVHYSQTVEAETPEQAIAIVRENFEDGGFCPESGAEIGSFEATEGAA